MKIDLKEFIEKYKNEINNRLFEKIYSLATTGELDSSDVGRLTELLYKCKIDPLEYMTKVPIYYSYGSAIKDIKIPDKIISIGKQAFAFCSDLTSVTIPSSVTSIGSSAFRNCSGLTRLTIPSSVTFIGWGTLQGCRSLKAINYKGSKKQWDLISKDTDWNRGTSIEAIRCIDGDITL